MINIEKHTIFTEDIYSFVMPAHEDWSEKIKNIITVEDNKEIHQHTTIPKEACKWALTPQELLREQLDSVMGKRTAWDSHLRYPILQSLIKELVKIIQIFIEKENFDAPILVLQECWINWLKKNDHVLPHIHPRHLVLVYAVDVEETGADLLWIKSDSYQLANKGEKIRNDIKSLKIKNGSVVMFNGNLLHAVTPNLSNKTRVTFIANFEVGYINDEK